MTTKLYCFGESGNSYKAALTLTLAGVPWKPVHLDFFNGEARSDAFRKLTVMGEAPVLVDGDLVLSQSGAIQLRVVRQTGRFGWADEAEEAEVMRWLFWDNHKGSSQFGMLRFLMNFLSPEHRSGDVIAFLTGRVQTALRVLDDALAGRDWLATSGPSIADFACAGYLFYDEPFGYDRKALPNIDRWLGRIEALPGWKHPYDLMRPAFPDKKA